MQAFPNCTVIKTNKKRIAILGSTGSIGTQALEVIRAQSLQFEVEVLTAYQNSQLLIQQAAEFRPNVVVIGDEKSYDTVFAALDPLGIKVYSGASALASVVQMDSVDTVLTAMVGYAGLLPTIKAIEAGKPIALANKETLVVAGELVTKLAAAKGVNIYPVDSEHSAIFQCLLGEFQNPIEKLILTASGGPFRGHDASFLKTVTKTQALKHPNWAMGAKITIDSATLMNKGLEVIEARWLFGIQAKSIDVWVHPQSIVHSMVQFTDGSVKAQMGLPDMKLPIQFALGYPFRLPSAFPRLTVDDCVNLTFEKPDLNTFQALALAYTSLEKGGNMPCVLNAANEVAVHEFLSERIGFLDIADAIQTCMSKAHFIPNPTLEDLIATDAETRTMANRYFSQLV